jgi:hypothetical protein
MAGHICMGHISLERGGQKLSNGGKNMLIAVVIDLL